MLGDYATHKYVCVYDVNRVYTAHFVFLQQTNGEQQRNKKKKCCIHKITCMKRMQKQTMASDWNTVDR